MDAKAALSEIQSAEVRAKQIIEEAQRQAQGIIAQAMAEKERIISKRSEEAKVEAQKMKARMEKEANQEVSLIAGQGQKDIVVLEEKSLLKMEEALEFIRDKINQG